MSRIDELIEELCPEGVPYRSLPTLARIDRGLTYQKSDEDPHGSIVVLRSNNIDQASNTVSLVDTKRLRSDLKPNPKTRLVEGDILISAASGSRSHVGKVAYISRDPDAYFGGFMMAIRAGELIQGRYLFHILTSSTFREYLDQSLSSSTINNINSAVLEGFNLPVPPLEVQREIVSILDKFTQLEAELEAELEARRIQYEVARDRLLDFGGDFETHPLGRELRQSCPSGVPFSTMQELADLNWGNTSVTKAQFVSADDSYPAFSASGQDGRLPFFDFDREAVILSAIGALAGKTWLTSGKWSAIKNTIRFFSRDENVISTQFLYWVTSSPKSWPRRGAAQPFISKGDADKLIIPVPPIEIQREIVSILDKLDALVNDIIIGLPAEIAARRKQYEYYRNKLLTFKELEAA